MKKYWSLQCLSVRQGSTYAFAFYISNLKWKLLQNICFCSEDAEMMYAWVLSNASMTRIENSYKTNRSASCCVLGWGTKLASLITWRCVFDWLCCLMRHRAPLSDSGSSAVHKLPHVCNISCSRVCIYPAFSWVRNLKSRLRFEIEQERKHTDKERAAFWSCMPLQKPHIWNNNYLLLEGQETWSFCSGLRGKCLAADMWI